ncbi:MAG: ABC transporter substrate-binding protein, partial [Acidimicrobiaceae bacterium]|nr:ABC transporter substrate-binding protein [Acidimicrobiaceae bacterium]
MAPSHLSRRRFLGRTAAGAGLLLGGGRILTACGDDEEAAPATTTAAPTTTAAATTTVAPTTTAAPELAEANFQLSWFDSVQFGGSYIAHQRGYYERFGLDVSLVPGGPGVSPDAAVAADQALVGISAANFTGQSVADGAPFKIVGVAMQKNPFVIASLSDNPI